MVLVFKGTNMTILSATSGKAKYLLQGLLTNCALYIFRENKPTFFHSLMWPDRTTIQQQSQYNYYFETAIMISPSSRPKSKTTPNFSWGLHFVLATLFSAQLVLWRAAQL